MFNIIETVFSKILYFALYFENASAFPKPLSASEEYECFCKFRENGDLAAKDKLTTHNLRLVAHIIKKYYSVNDCDDLISIGTIGLIKAVSSFNYKKGTRFATYASRCIENEILMYFRTLKKTQNNVSLSDPIDIDSEGNTLTLGDIIAEETDIFESIDNDIKIKKLYSAVNSCLEKRERDIIALRYGLYETKPMAQREVAKKLGISRSYVSRIEKKALLKLKRYMK